MKEGDTDLFRLDPHLIELLLVVRAGLGAVVRDEDELFPYIAARQPLNPSHFPHSASPLTQYFSLIPFCLNIAIVSGMPGNK